MTLYLLTVLLICLFIVLQRRYARPAWAGERVGVLGRMGRKLLDHTAEDVNHYLEEMGQKDRVVPLPQSLRSLLFEHLGERRRLHQDDLAQGLGDVFLPDALTRKYPNAPKEWIWQYVFASGRLSVDPRSGQTRRHHIHENGLQKSLKKAALAASITKRVNCHALRHSFANHVLRRGGHGVTNPLDSL